MKITPKFVLACSLSLLLSASVEARGEYQTALDFYAKKQYPSAAQYFETASLADPANLSANYYAGYCFYLAGQRPKAIDSFWRLARGYPLRKEGAQALAFLKQIDPDFTKNRAGEPTKPSIAEAVKAAVPKLSAKALTDKLVEVKPSAGKNANVSANFIKLAKEMVAAMPAPILQFLLDNGAKIVLVSSTVEHDMRIQNTVPRGWDEGFSWKESPALTEGSKVVMSQFRAHPRTGDAVDTTEELGVLRHETGHALDYCLGEVTESSEFKHAHYLDAAKCPDEYRQKLDYYLQKASNGPSETFAELFCYRMGGETDSHRKEICELVHKCFPLCDAELGKQLARFK